MDPIGRFALHGVALIERALEDDDLLHMAAAFSGDGNAAGGERQSRMPARLISYLREHETLSELASRLAAAPARLVRVLAFDKTPQANWFVPWHQDRAVALAGRVETEGFARWTFKDGCHHAEPPVALLENMATLRVHLDDCGPENGPIEAIPGSHEIGRLDRPGIEGAVAKGGNETCVAARGDILAMRPLLVHRSQRARAPGRRRVLHLEYAASALPDGLRWALDAEPSSAGA